MNKIKTVKGQWANNYNYNSNPRGTNLPSSTSQDSEAEQTPKMTSVITTWKKEKENSACVVRAQDTWLVTGVTREK